MALTAAKQNEPKFTQPFRQFVFMSVSLALVAAIAWLLIPTVASVFFASPYLNGLIVAVFVLGIIACFAQLFSIVRSVSWIEGFALDRPGHEFTAPPRLLLPLAQLLSDTRARRGLTSSSTATILDSVGQRLDEARDITRYITNLLIFLGLLGTFYGLATTVPAVVETIKSLEPADGQSIDFAALMAGLESQLGGMGTAFASSLLGLAGSLVVGLLELFAGHGQNRFYMELEEWLSTITRIGVTGPHEGAPASVSGLVETLVEQNALQIESLREIFAQSEERRAESDRRIEALAGQVGALAGKLGDLTETMQAGAMQAGERPEGVDAETLRHLAQGQERLAQALSGFDGEAGGLDTEARARLRSIDLHLLRILEEMSAGRQDAVSELRAELAQLTQIIRERTGG